jgi:protein-disulfide isomerase
MKDATLWVLCLVLLAGCLGEDAPAPKDIANWTTLADGGATLGNPDAKVTIVEFSDFECPFCSKFHKKTMPALREKYIDAGKARIVFRNFPLEFHASAMKAAEAVECAGVQGRFWQMADKAFDNQADLTRDNYRTWAGEIGVEDVAFSQCLDTDMKLTKVKNDIKDADDIGVRSVPTFFINGRVVEGAQEPEIFERIIDEELNK